MWLLTHRLTGCVSGAVCRVRSTWLLAVFLDPNQHPGRDCINILDAQWKAVNRKLSLWYCTQVSEVLYHENVIRSQQTVVFSMASVSTKPKRIDPDGVDLV
jgi:hypothetical protein